MQGIIHIIDDIGEFADVQGVTLQTIISQVKAQPQADSFLVKIRTNGGEVNTGFEIYNYLRSLNKPITTRAIGGVYSIGVVLFMAGHVRQVQENADLMIHNPMIVPEQANFLEAVDLENMAKDMRETESQIAKFLSKTTNNPIEAIAPLMEKETYINASQAIELGFATELFTPLSQVAFAYINPKKNKMSKDKKETKKRTFIQNLQKLIASHKVNLIVRTAEGDDLDFFELTDGENISIGDLATINGGPADGTYLLPSGESYVFVDGALDSIVEANADDSQSETDSETVDMESLTNNLFEKIEKSIDEKLKPVIDENKRLNEILNKRETTFNALSKLVGQELNDSKGPGEKQSDSNKSDKKESDVVALQRRLAEKRKNNKN